MRKDTKDIYVMIVCMMKKVGFDINDQEDQNADYALLNLQIH